MPLVCPASLPGELIREIDAAAADETGGHAAFLLHLVDDLTDRRREIDERAELYEVVRAAHGVDDLNGGEDKQSRDRNNHGDAEPLADPEVLEKAEHGYSSRINWCRSVQPQG